MLNARKNIINFFEKWTFPFNTKLEESEENKLEKIKNDYNEFFEYIKNESEGINYNLFKKYFNFEAPTVLASKLYETKGKNKNNDLVKLIKITCSDLKDEIEKMSEDEKKTWKTR